MVGSARPSLCPPLPYVVLGLGSSPLVGLDQVATVPRPGLGADPSAIPSVAGIAHAFAVKEARDHAWDTDLPVH
jgi:hypothetical protein